MNRLRLALAALCAALALPAAADTVRASSTTLLLSRESSLAGDMENTLPIFEILSVTASDMELGIAEEVEIAFSTWGAVDLADVRTWQNGATTDKRLTGDIDVAYVKGELLNRRLVLRLGRQMIADGSARMVHVDGGQLKLRVPGNFGLSGYAGIIVPPRFGSRTNDRFGTGSFGNHRGEFAYGGRVSWFAPGLLEVGVSTAMANEDGDPSRRDVGADLRVELPRDLQLTSSAFYSLYDERLGEAEVELAWRGARAFSAAAEYRHVAPDLLLPRTSILSVFADDDRNEVGGWVELSPFRKLELTADYHLLLEDPGTGHRARGKAVYEIRPRTDLGAEVTFLTQDEDENGYWMARAFGSQALGAFDATLDLQSYFLERDVNGEDLSLSATATVAWRFARGFKAQLGATAGTDPYYSKHIDVMAKLVYDQIYVTGGVQ